MRLILTTAALKQLRGLPKRDQDSLLTALERVAVKPFATHPQARALKGGADTFRLRQGEWRAIYHLQREEDTMVVTRIGHRREVYE